MKNNVIVFSDLHRSDGTGADACGITHERAIYAELVSLENENAIIAAGDIDDYLKTTPHRLRKIYGNKLTELIAENRIDGNHEYKRLCLPQYLKFGECIVTHGHLWDGYDLGSWSRIGLQMWTGLLRFFNIGRKKTNYMQENVLCENYKHYKQYLKNAAIFAIKNNVKILVFGHSHKAGIWFVGKKNLIPFAWSHKYFILDPYKVAELNDCVILVNIGRNVDPDFQYAQIKNYRGRIGSIEIVRRVL